MSESYMDTMRKANPPLDLGKVKRESYIKFEALSVSKGMVTKRWQVKAIDGGAVLGWVYWYPAWRRYVFHANPKIGAIFEETCMHDIADFVATQTMYRRLERKAK